MSLTQELIGLIRARPITDQDLEAAALFTLDAVASACAGSATPVGAILRQWGGSRQLDHSRAAWLLAALTHITETDDLHRISVTHPGCVVVPAALALGQQTGASGTRILTAILHGFEAMCRIGATVGPAHYRIWHNTATCGPFGAAMTAASLLDLNAEQTRDALGNAGTQASGFWQFIETGAMSKHLHAGHACEAGLLAADLAQQGFTGPAEILEGKKGFYAAMCPDPAPSSLLAEPDGPWQLHQTSIKPWPSCRHTHPLIDCALELQSLTAGAPIDAVVGRTYQAALDVCDKPQPESEYEAKFSLYHCTAMALLDGRVGLDSFDATARERSADLRERCTFEVRDPYQSRYPVSWGAEVEVRTSAGESFKVSRQDCKGDPELALDSAEMRSKAMGLLEFAGFSTAIATELCDRILELPQAGPGRLFSEILKRLECGDVA